MTYFEKYKAILSDFLDNNTYFFENAKIFNPDKDSVSKYIPAHTLKDSPDSILNSQPFKDLIQTFFEHFLMDESIVFDINGHIKDLHDKKLVDVLNTESYYFSKKELFHSLSFTILYDLFRLYSNKKENKEIFFSSLFLSSDDSFKIIDSTKCNACNEHISLYLNLETKKISHYKEIKKCPFSESIPNEIKVDLKVPSKKLVFLNDPRSFLSLEREDKYKISINSLLGCIKETEMYSEHNVGFFFIGNSMPAIMQKDGEIIFTHGYDEEDEDENGFNPKYSDYKLKGYVCADLWWYTLLDYDLFVSIYKKKSVDFNEIDHVVVDIESDKCTVYHSLKAHKEGHDDGVFSTIKY